MALIWHDGFEDYNDSFPMSLNYVLSGTWSSTYDFYQETGRFADSKAFRFYANISTGTAFTYTLSTALTAAAVGVSMKQSGFSDASTSAEFGMNGIIFYSLSGTAANHLRVYVNAAGKVVVQRGVSGNILATSVASVASGTWFHLGVELVRNASTGSVNVYLDGVNIISLTGVNTGSDGISRIGPCASGGGANITVDDFYICDAASWLGEARVSPLAPNADSAQKDFTASTGSDNYACVDEQPPSVSDYVSSATVGAKDLYDIEDLSYTPLNILGVKVSMLASKDEITTRTMRNVIKSGSTTANGETQALSSTSKLVSDIWTTDPSTGAAWTKSGVDALQVGVELVA